MAKNPEETRYDRFLRDSGLDDIEAKIEDAKNKEVALGDLVDVDIKNAKPGDVLTMPGKKWMPGKPSGDGTPVPLDNYYTKEEADQLIETRASVDQLNSIAQKAEVAAPKTEVSKCWTRLYTLENRVNEIEETASIDAFTKEESNALFGSKQLLDNAMNRIDSLESRPEPDVYTKEQANYLFVRQDDLLSVANRIDNKADADAVSELDSRIDALELEQEAYSKEESDAKYLSRTSGEELNSKILALEARNEFDPSLYYTKVDWDSSVSSINNRLSIVEGRALFDPVQYYTKTQSDSKFALKTDLTNATTRITSLEGRPTFDPASYYNKTASDSTFALKTDLSSLTTRVTSVEGRPTFDSSSYYTKTQVDSSLSSKSGVEMYPLSEYGMIGSSIHPNTAINTISMTNGKLWLTRVYVPANAAISKVFFSVKTAGSLPGTATSGVAVYSDTGTQLGTVLLNTLFTTTGWKTATLSSAIPAQSTGRFVYVGIVCNFSTIPGLYGVSDGPWNLQPSTHRRNISIASTTVFPTNFTPASYANNENIMPLIGLG